MKNTDPPDSNHKKPRLSPELSRFIENLGTFFESYGIPRIGGRMLGLLLVTSQPLSAESIASVLKVSRASVSTNFRLLIASSLAEKVSVPGSRTTYYVFPEGAWDKVLNVEIRSITAMQTLAEQGMRALAQGDPARRRLREMVDWAEYLLKLFERALEDWRARGQPEMEGLSAG
jgi:DNA-binding transcriptional regulator GbsR (MarR family)